MLERMTRVLWVLGFILVVATPPGRFLLYLLIGVPAMALVVLLGAWALARAMGAGHAMGHELGRDVDVVVTAGLLAALGAFATVARGVGESGLISAALLTAGFLAAVVRRHARPGAFSAVLVLAVWAALGWRLSHPLVPRPVDAVALPLTPTSIR